MHGKHFNIQLNQQIMRVSDTRELCHIISKYAAQFDNVNVATSFRKVLQVPRDGVLSGIMQQALETLEKCAMRNMEAFQPQEIANILHMTAKKRYKTCLLPELVRRA